MDFYALPQALYPLEGITHILSHHDNAILHKKLTHDIIDAEALIVSHSIVYVVNGKVQINTPEGEEVVVENGEMLFTPRDSYLISDYLRNGEDMEVYLLFFDHEVAQQFLATQEVFTPAPSSICKLHPTDNILRFLENIHKMHLENHHDKALLELKLLEFLHLIAQEDKAHFITTLQASEAHKQKRDILSLMQTHFDKNLTIADFAALSGRSLSTFNREFKAQFSQTPKQWLIEKKMQKAHILLTQGHNVTQTAFEVGYQNVSHFIKAYKSVYNKTPKEMQKQHF
jgi:AraC-like DNA-binding protein